MIPKVNFEWSSIYQRELHMPRGIDFNLKEFDEYITKYIKKLSKKWNKIAPNILKYIEKISGLKWKKKEINCYVLKITSHKAISDPISISTQFKAKDGKIYDTSISDFIDILIHELIHNIFIQNKSPREEYFDYLVNKYKISFETSSEIPVHAIHKEIYLKFFDEKRLKKDIWICSIYPNHKKSWEIVNKEGSRNIIKEMKKFIE